MEGDSEKMPERVVATRVRPSPEGYETWNTTATIIRKDAESEDALYALTVLEREMKGR